MATMHPDEIQLDETLVRGLLERQVPEFAQQTLRRDPSSGTVNAMFRLGEDKVVRLPFVEWGSADIEFEQRWLPRLAQDLTIPIPTVLHQGHADDTYPCAWSVMDWLPGELPDVPNGTPDEAHELATFVSELRRIDTDDAPTGYRGGPVREHDAEIRKVLPEIAGEVDIDTLAGIWDRALAAPDYEDEPRWAHGDLLATNVLVSGGHLAGILDFSAAGVGDPACDLMAAWSILPTTTRDVFRADLDIDDAEWDRGRGWAMVQAVMAVPYYRETNPGMVSNSLRMLNALIEN
jgi:aminoglycoside phosphotransferase (APT) family kinase protein